MSSQTRNDEYNKMIGAEVIEGATIPGLDYPCEYGHTKGWLPTKRTAIVACVECHAVAYLPDKATLDAIDEAEREGRNTI